MQLLDETGFNDNIHNCIDDKIVDLLPTKDEEHKYNFKIVFSYKKDTDYTPCLEDYAVRYDEDDEEIYFYTLISRMYFDDILLGEYESSLEMTYQTEYFVYNINKLCTSLSLSL